MTRIDFHTKVPEPIAYACRLVRLAANEGLRTVVACRDEAELAQLDAALWTFSEQDFLPHVRAGDALDELIEALTTEDQAAQLAAMDGA